MIKKILVAFSVFALTALAFAGTTIVPAPTPPPVQQAIGSELEAALLSGWLNTDIEGIYAPTLAKHLGAELKLWHPITDASSPFGAGVGVSLMALNGNYYSGSFGASLKTTFTIPGLEQFPITPRAEVGAYIPFVTTTGTTQASDNSLGAYTEAGAMIQLWHNNAGTVTFSVGGSYKRIFETGGGFNTYNGLAELRIKL